MTKPAAASHAQHPVPSRRERKRAATREALRTAALRLFAERGYTATTITDIVDAVDVSERTFFRYFPTKEDVLLHDLIELGPKLADALSRRPPTEPPLRAILAALWAVREQGRLDRISTLLPAALPSLFAPETPGASPRVPSARVLQIFAEWEAGLVAALLTRAGADPARPDEHALLRAEVTARAALAGLRTALNRHRALAGEGRADEATFAVLVAQAFAVLEDGCSPRASDQPAAQA